mmetsp:Transcript_17211/g.36156  ORF Transcript_17211/g.36156 Transcript_17211/m.36156 type:complete len:81 (+) Transcript_17211:425-667(+)
MGFLLYSNLLPKRCWTGWKITGRVRHTYDLAADTVWWCVVTLGKLHSLGKPQRQKFVSLLPELVVHKPDVIRQLQKFVAS